MNDDIRTRNRRHSALRAASCSLKEACQEIGRDEGGRRCRDCLVRDLCEDESRWLVRRDDRQQSGRLH